MDQQVNTDSMAFIARTFATEKMIAASYSDYCQSVVDNFSKLLEIATMAVSGEFNDKTLPSYGYPIAANIFLNRQTCSVYNLMMDIQYSSSVNDDSDDDDLLNTPLLSINDQWKYDTVEEVLEELNCTFHAICSEAAIAQGFKLGGEVAERITIARDYIMQKFCSGYTDFSGSLEYAIQSMKDSINVTDWIARIMKNDGLDDLSNEVIPDIEQSEAFKYSGASATSAYCWDTVGKAIAATAAVAAKAVTGAVKGILSIGKKLFKKIKKKVIEIAVDPYDLEKLDPKEEGYTIDGYHDHAKETFYLNPGKLGMLGNKLRLKEWYHTDWFCSEVMSRVTDVFSQFIFTNYPSGVDGFGYVGCLQRLAYCVTDGSFQASSSDTIESLATMLLNTYHSDHPYSFNFPDFNSARDQKPYNLLFINIFSMILGNMCSEEYIYNAVQTNKPEKKSVSYLLQYLSDTLDKVSDIANYSPSSNGIFMEGGLKPHFDRYIDDLNRLKYDVLWYGITLYCGFALGSVYYKAEELVRYKPVNYRFLSTLSFQIGNSEWVFDGYKAIAAFKDIIDDADPYADVTDPEWFLFNSFQFGKLCHQMLSCLLRAEAHWDATGDPVDFSNYQEKINNDEPYLVFLNYYVTNGYSFNNIPASSWGNLNTVRSTFPDLSAYSSLATKPGFNYQLFSNIPVFVNATCSITNKNFFNSATGQYPTVSGYYTFENVNEQAPLGMTSITTVMNSIMYNIYMQWQYPFSYPYWPYSKSVIEWFDPSFRIRTDQENISAFNTFITVAVVVVAIVVVGGVTCTLLKRAAMKASLTEKGLSAQFAQKAAAGTLTKADLKTYKKAVKKANRLSKLSGNLNTPAVSTATTAINLCNNNEETINAVGNDLTENNNSSLEQILSIIQG